jgi:hypothetical protein
MTLYPDPYLPYSQSGWLEQAQPWIDTELEHHGLQAAGPLKLIHTRPWSALACLDTDQGRVYFKALSPALRFEAALGQALWRWRPDCSLSSLAVDLEQGWILSLETGVTLRSLIQSPADLQYWERILPLYASLQIEMAEREADILALGVPDRRLATFPNLYNQLLEDKGNLQIDQAAGLSSAELQALRDLRPRFVTLCERLDSFGLPETLTHEEVHDANVLIKEGRSIFIDWSDSSFAHPFFTLLVTLRSAAFRLKLEEYGPEMTRLRDIYLESWTPYGTNEDLLEAYRLAYRLAMVNRSLSYYHILQPLTQANRAENDAIPGWLQDFLVAEVEAKD